MQRMKLQPGILPFPALSFWGKTTMAYAGTMTFYGISRQLPVSRLSSEGQRKTGCNFILRVETGRCAVSGHAAQTPRELTLVEGAAQPKTFHLRELTQTVRAGKARLHAPVVKLE